jgi:D-beta-D-heptose 7-phosphate kinase/D-beta-D-heptose 1-phosphate adenosyltransferase
MNAFPVKPKNIMVFGDIILDKMISGTIHRIANEAPVPVVLYQSEKKFLGGCGNVVMNIQALGCEKLYVFSMIGNDSYGKEISEMLSGYPEIIQHLSIDDSYTTTVKTRGFSDKKIIFRYDIERRAALLASHMKKTFYDVRTILETTRIDAIVISDYNRGYLVKELTQYVIQLANEKGVDTFVDSKTDYTKYIGCTLIKPNRKELLDVFGIEYRYSELENIHFIVKEKVSCKETLFTLSEEGMSLGTEDGKILNQAAEECEVNDVTGAGDVVISVIAYYYKSLSRKQLIQLATYVATTSVKHVGTYVLKYSDILQGCKSIYTTKVIRVEDVKYLKHPIIFTNGCFDIIHEGHLALFQYCKSLCQAGGDVMVAINSDASIKRIKGEKRPINSEDTRVALLNSITSIDWIVVFDEDTPYRILEKIQPHTLVKGGDYTVESLIGKQFCESVKIFTYMPGKSTTNTIKKVLDMSGEK